ncbi:MAG: tetratricopeptide repeat protein [Proteobacteria bacterium]|nr:tetratricopeptide repeat protein [Pseudomonadota bacterium]
MLRRAWLLSLVSVPLLAPQVAHADDIAARLNAFETEARTLADLPKPQLSQADAKRKLVDAIVAYRLGDYDGSAVALFDLLGSKAIAGAESEQAVYYLAEALFQKGDRGAASSYYTQIVSAGSGKYYQNALLRLVEIAARRKEEATETLAAIDRISANMRLPQTTYVRGKYAYANDQYDEALAYFVDVPKGTAWELPALYYTGAIQVAKKDLQKATDIYIDLVGRKPKTANDRRIIELSQLALGRIYYERDQFSKSIDSYLYVDRNSDLFSDALYEISWVYVKNKQFDKALTALELLAKADPNSTKTPTVRLLEGNLRIRKAQLIRQAEILGTISAEKAAGPDDEYAQATTVFADIHGQFHPGYKALAAAVDGNLDPTQWVMQIAGRSSSGFTATAPLPDMAVQWLREEPNVQRFVAIEADLGAVQQNIDEAEATIARLEAIIAANDRTAIYTQLNSRRTRAGVMQDDLIKVRIDLADQALRLIDANGELSQLSTTRKTLAGQYANLGNPEQAYADRLAKTRADYDAIETSEGEIDTAIDQTRASAVALRKYVADADAKNNTDLANDQKAAYRAQLDEIAKEAAAIDAEVVAFDRELQLGRDLVGLGDEQIGAAHALRKQLKAALDGEHRVLAGFASTSRDAGKSRGLATLGDQATRIAASLEQIETSVDAQIDANVAQAKQQLAAERVTLATYRAELKQYDDESREVGTAALAASFKAVRDKMYDVVIRADVGTVDVAWSQKSDTDDDIKRFGLNQSLEQKQLHDEFKDILEEKVPKPSAPKKAMPEEPKDAGDSPDKKGAPATRVKPADKAPTKAAPTVKAGAR